MSKGGALLMRMKFFFFRAYTGKFPASAADWSALVEANSGFSHFHRMMTHYCMPTRQTQAGSPDPSATCPMR